MHILPAVGGHGGVAVLPHGGRQPARRRLWMPPHGGGRRRRRRPSARRHRRRQKFLPADREPNTNAAVSDCLPIERVNITTQKHRTQTSEVCLWQQLSYYQLTFVEPQGPHMTSIKQTPSTRTGFGDVNCLTWPARGAPPRSPSARRMRGTSKYCPPRHRHAF